MSTNQLAKVDQFKAVLNDNQIRAQLKNSLKENSGAFMSSMLDLYSGDSYLQNCDPRAVAAECLKAASLNLPILKSLGFAYVVPYKNHGVLTPTFIVGYKGLIQLAQRTGQYKTINAGIVYEGELVGYDKLSGDVDLNGEKISDDVIGYFAYLKLVSGFEKTLYMTKSEVDAWRSRYSKTKSDNTPWGTEYDKMAMKTCLRRLISTYGAMSVQMMQALQSDGEQKPVSEKVQQEVRENANKEIIDIDAETGEIIETNATIVESEPDIPPDIEETLDQPGF